MDSASAEYQFLKGFFGVEDSSLFDEEFKDVCKYVRIFGISHFVVQYTNSGLGISFGGYIWSTLGGNADSECDECGSEYEC